MSRSCRAIQAGHARSCCAGVSVSSPVGSAPTSSDSSPRTSLKRTNLAGATGAAAPSPPARTFGALGTALSALTARTSRAPIRRGFRRMARSYQVSDLVEPRDAPEDKTVGPWRSATGTAPARGASSDGPPCAAPREDVAESARRGTRRTRARTAVGWDAQHAWHAQGGVISPLLANISMLALCARGGSATEGRSTGRGSSPTRTTSSS
jgi:hypothetical protein